ncbi:unnamed protein product [Vicia faba]|uniref:Cysteine-rich receptor-like protein kinase n=1 Tax=Vicia faba TaxID=3906 RepID=A0AAV0YR78_VICFA|nr:unnamed protein product [Vicia faba]
MQWQKSKLNWLRVGDGNSKFYHGFMSSRRRSNTITYLSVNDALVEGVAPIKEAVFQHFQSHFKVVGGDRPEINNLSFKTLSGMDGADLIKSFTMEEVKQAVWDCDSYKSPGPNGVSFGFIKEFWELLKDDLLRFFMKFHRNGKLARGINSTSLLRYLKLTVLSGLGIFVPFRWL